MPVDAWKASLQLNLAKCISFHVTKHTHTQTQSHVLPLFLQTLSICFCSWGPDLIIDVHNIPSFELRTSVLFTGTNIVIRTVFWLLFLIRPYRRTTSLHWGGIGISMYCSVTEQPQEASSAHPITKVVTPCLISLMVDPWQAAPALTSHGPQINVLTAGCGREGRPEHPSCLSDHNTRG